MIHHGQVELILRIQCYFIIQKLFSAIHHINRKKKENDNLSIWGRKPYDKFNTH